MSKKKNTQKEGFLLSKARRSGGNLAKKQWLSQMGVQVKDPSKNVFGVDLYKIEENETTKKETKKFNKREFPGKGNDGLAEECRGAENISKERD